MLTGIYHKTNKILKLIFYIILIMIKLIGLNMAWVKEVYLIKLGF